MAYFKNKSFNIVYLQTILAALAFHGGESFAFVYLLKAGVPLPLVIACIGGMYASRLIFRMAVVPVALRIGLKSALVLACIVEGLSYPVLSFVDGVGYMLLAYLALWSFSSSMYWTTLHAYIALTGDNEHRGRQISGLEFIGAVMGIFGPLMTGLLLTYTTPLIAFVTVGFIMAVSAVPILFGPDVEIPKHAVIAPETRRFARHAMFGDGIRAAWFHYCWLIALFLTLGENFANFGGTLALAGVAGAVMGLVSGRVIDTGNGKLALQVGIAAMMFAGLFRAFGFATVWSAVPANAAAVIAWPLFAAPFNAKLYQRSKASSCSLRYHVIAEGGWDFGNAVGCAIAGLLIYFGFSFFWPLMLGVLANVLIYWVVAPEYEFPAPGPSPQSGAG